MQLIGTKKEAEMFSYRFVYFHFVLTFRFYFGTCLFNLIYSDWSSRLIVEDSVGKLLLDQFTRVRFRKRIFLIFVLDGCLEILVQGIDSF